VAAEDPYLRAKARVGSAGFYAKAEEAAEKGRIWDRFGEKHTSVPKGHIDSVALMPGINPRPTSKLSFSAVSEALAYL
jgi:hypothetical protein